MIHTNLCDLLGIQHPIVQSGMAGPWFTNPELVAAVSNAGGLGILGCCGRTPEMAVADIRRIRTLTDRPFGVNFVLHGLNEETFRACLAERPPLFAFFRGQPAEAVARAHAVGARTMHQVTTVAEAQEACAAGVDVLVAQGHEAGGHNGPLPLLSLLPAVIAVADERPVLAAGGIVNGADLAAMLCLGAAGVLMGTRFLATAEAPISPNYKKALVAADGPDATVSSTVFDILWDDPWPGVQVRALHNGFMRRWLGHEEELKAQRAQAVAAFRQAEREDNVEERGMLAGVGAGRIQELKPAGQLLREMVDEAAQTLQGWGRSVGEQTEGRHAAETHPSGVRCPTTW